MRLLALLALACCTLAARAQDDHLSPEALHAAGLTKYWQLDLPLPPNEMLVDLYRVDDVIYAATNTGYVYAVHAPTGIVRWLQQVTTGGYHITAPAHARGRTVFVIPSAIVEFNAISGDPVRKINLRFPAGSPPISNGKYIWFGGIDHRIYCFDPDLDFELWKAGVGAPITARPALVGKFLFTAATDGFVYVCSAASKRFVRAAQTEESISAELAVGPQGVFAASEDQSLYLISSEFGTKVWRTRLSAPLTEGPVITPDTAYQYCSDDGVVAIDSRVEYVSDRIRWKLPQGRRLLTVDDKHAYVQNTDGDLLIVDRGTGSVESTIPSNGLSMGSPAPADQAVYLASPDGRMFCARPVGAPPLKREALLDAYYGTATSRPASQPAASQPAPAPRLDNPPSTLPPIGGTSKVSKAQTGGTGAGSQPAKP